MSTIETLDWADEAFARGGVGIALRRAAGPGTGRRLAEPPRAGPALQLPEMYLAKHLQAMVKAGLLQAASGPRGGFRLGKPAENITVLQVVEAIEGAAPPFICQEIRQRAPGGLSAEECAQPCTVSAVMAAAHRAWRTSLRSVTVADIEAGLPQSVRDRGVG